MRNVKNKIFTMVFALTFTISSVFYNISPASAFTPDFAAASDAVFMVNLDTDLAVYKKNEFKAVWPASTTKIMTALIVLENVENLNDFVLVDNRMNEGFGENPNFTGVQAAGLVVGQTNLTYLDCLYALLIYSACDAANVLAYNVGGSIQGFVDMMNRKALELGAVNTAFGNAHGLHQKDNYSCAYDIFLITKYVMNKFPQFMEIANTREYQLPPNSRSANPDGDYIRNTNRLIENQSDRYFYQFAKGVKTGSMDVFHDVDTGADMPGAFNLVSTAMQNGYTYLLVTLGAPYYTDGGERSFAVYDDHFSLYSWAFSSLTYQTVLSVDEIVGQVTVLNGQDADRVQLKAAQDYSTLLPANIDRTAVHRAVTSPGEIEAPVTRGEVLGFVELVLEEEVLIRIDLIAASDVAKSTVSSVTETVGGIFDTVWFKAIVAIVAALTIFAVILRIINTNRRSRLNRRRRPRI